MGSQTRPFVDNGPNCKLHVSGTNEKGRTLSQSASGPASLCKLTSDVLSEALVQALCKANNHDGSLETFQQSLSLLETSGSGC